MFVFRIHFLFSENKNIKNMFNLTNFYYKNIFHFCLKAIYGISWTKHMIDRLSYTLSMWLEIRSLIHPYKKKNIYKKS